MNFIISTTVGAPIQYGEGKSIQQNRFHNGVTPIMGPVEDSDLQEVLDFLKNKDKDVTYIVLKGFVVQSSPEEKQEQK